MAKCFIILVFFISTWAKVVIVIIIMLTLIIITITIIIVIIMITIIMMRKTEKEILNGRQKRNKKQSLKVKYQSNTAKMTLAGWNATMSPGKHCQNSHYRRKWYKQERGRRSGD